MENVCISVDDDSFMYAVGSKAHTDLLDARTLQVIQILALQFCLIKLIDNTHRCAYIVILILQNLL